MTHSIDRSEQTRGELMANRRDGTLVLVIEPNDEIRYSLTLMLMENAARARDATGRSVRAQSPGEPLNLRQLLGPPWVQPAARADPRSAELTGLSAGSANRGWGRTPFATARRG